MAYLPKSSGSVENNISCNLRNRASVVPSQDNGSSYLIEHNDLKARFQALNIKADYGNNQASGVGSVGVSAIVPSKSVLMASILEFTASAFVTSSSILA